MEVRRKPQEVLCNTFDFWTPIVKTDLRIHIYILQYIKSLMQALCRKNHIINAGVNDGARTHDHRNHNPGLYQLSYAHHRYQQLYNQKLMARPTGIEPVTPSLEGWCSIRLSYGRNKRASAIVMVGEERFELPTSCSQSRRATRLRYTPTEGPKLYRLEP